MPIARALFATVVVTIALASCASDLSDPGMLFTFVKAKEGSTFALTTTRSIAPTP